MNGRTQGSMAFPGALGVMVVLLLAGLTLALVAATEHVHRVADKPLPLPVGGGSVPMALFHWLLPILLLLAHWFALRAARLSPGLSWLVTLLALLSIGLIWLSDLVRHDRQLSLFHCLVFLLVFRSGTAGYRRLVAWLAPGLAAGLLALVSYGAIWGETRCHEKTAVGCLVSSGPRVWVPELLQNLGVSVFAEMSGADLKGFNLSGRDLRYVDLRGAGLQGARLAGSNLRRARLEDVSARQSNWNAAYLDGASLARADLREADLGSVHAYRLDLRGADLRDTDLGEASLSHAWLQAALFDGARMPGAYLRFSAGLTLDQLANACGDGETRLPAGLDIAPCPGT